MKAILVYFDGDYNTPKEQAIKDMCHEIATTVFNHTKAGMENIEVTNLTDKDVVSCITNNVIPNIAIELLNPKTKQDIDPVEELCQQILSGIGNIDTYTDIQRRRILLSTMVINPDFAKSLNFKLLNDPISRKTFEILKKYSLQFLPTFVKDFNKLVRITE